jgi:phosphoribosylanthranilate isomerase
MKKVKALIKLVPIFVESVLVMVPTSTSQMIQACKKLHPTSIQIHGENIENLPTLPELLPNTRLIRAVTANSSHVPEAAIQGSEAFQAILLDSSINDKHGGTGIVHDWNVSKLARKSIHPTPLILAGGLTPENVQRAIRTVQPYAVDVCSGVESTPGIKDFQKLSTFIKNAKEVRICVN